MDVLPFGLRQRPFPTTPDSSVYYPATGHEEALCRLLQGLQDDEGILLLTGAPGMGKTLLCHCLLERLEAEQPSILLTNSHVRDRAGLLQALLFDLSLPYEGRGEQEMRLALTQHLLETFQQGKRTIVLIDEAQHLNADLLEELRLLGNLEARSGKAVQVVLIGSPQLLVTLGRPELAGLAQRLAVRVNLEPLDVQEAADYLLHHLRIAGAQGDDVVSGEALELLAQVSSGVPRRLNQVARAALAVAVEAGAEQIDAEVALETLSRLGLEVPAASEQTDESEMAGEGPHSLETPAVLPLPGKVTFSEIFYPEGQLPPNETSSQVYVAPRRPA